MPFKRYTDWDFCFFKQIMLSRNLETPWLGIDQIKFQSLFEGESDGQNGAKFRQKLRF